MKRTVVLAFNSAQKVEGNQVWHMINPSPSIQQFPPCKMPTDKYSSEPLQFDEQERYSGRDAGDFFLRLLRSNRKNSSEEDLLHCMKILSEIESLLFRASMGRFLSLWEKMTVQPSEQMAIKFRATWRSVALCCRGDTGTKKILMLNIGFVFSQAVQDKVG